MSAHQPGTVYKVSRLILMEIKWVLPWFSQDCSVEFNGWFKERHTLFFFYPTSRRLFQWAWVRLYAKNSFVHFTVSASPLEHDVSMCSLGPAYWCENFEQAVECNAVKHCFTNVWVVKEQKVIFYFVPTNWLPQSKQESKYSRSPLKDSFLGYRRKQLCCL